MPTSLTLSADVINTHALRLAGVLSPALSALAADLTSARELLNAHLKNLEEIPELSAQLSQWEKTVSVIANDTYKAISGDTESVYSAYYRNTNTNAIIPMEPMTQRELFETRATAAMAAATTKIFFAVSKAESGTHPVDGAVAARVLYFYPAIPANGTVYYVPKNKIDIFDSGASTGGLPAAFYAYLIHAMAVVLGLYHGASMQRIEVLAQLKQQAFDALFRKQAKDFATLETDSVRSNDEKKRQWQ